MTSVEEEWAQPKNVVEFATETSVEGRSVVRL